MSKSPTVRRWYKWSISGLSHVTMGGGYEYATSQGNAKARVYSQMVGALGEGLLEERDIMVRAVKLPPKLWLIKEFDNSIRAEFVATEWRNFIGSLVAGAAPVSPRVYEETW